MRRFMRFVIGGLALATTLHANPVSELDYQGRVLVNDLPFTGNGYFKFAIANAGGSTNYWSNDGTGTGQPAGHLTNSVFNGVFSTILGASPMTAINPSIFNNGSDLYLRVWFSTTTNAFSEMLPAQKIVSAAYAINAGLVGGQAPSQLVATAVAQATNGITMAGDVTGTPQANNIAAGVIVDTDVNANAAIAATKIANTALVQSTTFAGDVGGSFGNLQIGAGAVANTEVAATNSTPRPKTAAGMLSPGRRALSSRPCTASAPVLPSRPCSWP